MDKKESKFSHSILRTARISFSYKYSLRHGSSSGGDRIFGKGSEYEQQPSASFHQPDHISGMRASGRVPYIIIAFGRLNI